MRHISSISASIVLCCLPALSQAACNSSDNVMTTFSPRSPGRNKVMQTVGYSTPYFLEYEGNILANGSATFEYQQSFRDNDITRGFFGPFLHDSTTCKGKSFLVQGENVSPRGGRALLASNFYLPSNFSSEVSFAPRIRNINVHLDLYVDLQWLLAGSYFRVYVPITHTRWDLNMQEYNIAEGTVGYGTGVFTPGALSTTSLLNNFAEYAAGLAPEKTEGVTFQPLIAGRMLTKEKRKTGFSDLRAEYGINFAECADYHWGINIQGAAPVSKKRHACLLFEPRVGSDHWELGAGLTGHVLLWENILDECILIFEFDANITHQFATKEWRTFDLKEKPLSRYMLAQKLEANNHGLEGGIPQVESPVQFAQEFAPVANLTRQQVRVSSAAQADIVAQCRFESCNFSWTFGYNFWSRSCEKIRTVSEGCSSLPLADGNTWALKGNASVFGFVENTTTAIPLAATQSNATITSGILPNITGTVTNVGIDNPQTAFANGGQLSSAPNTLAAAASINTSIEPLFLSNNFVDLDVRTRGLSHSIFTDIHYRWECGDWQPYVGVGFKAEFGKDMHKCFTNNSYTVTRNCSRCIDASLSQWSVWLQFGTAFNC